MDIKFKNGLKIGDVPLKLTVTLAFAAAVAVMYVSGVGCVFRYLFEIRCPGCGLTRAIISFFRLDLFSAFEYHQLFWTTPVLYLYFLFDGRIFGRVADICILCGIFLAFFVRWIVVLV